MSDEEKQPIEKAAQVESPPAVTEASEKPANKLPEALPLPSGLEDEPNINEVLRVWATPEGKIYGVWADGFSGGQGLGGLLGSVAQMITVTGSEENTAERLRIVKRDFVAASARPHDKVLETFPKLLDYNEIVNAFHGETDRAAGILAAAWLDNYLGQALRYFLVQDEKETAELVGNEKRVEQPLGPFRVRGRALYLLGLISKEDYEDIGYISKIRNRFAHHPGITSFDDQQVKDWCSNLNSAKKGMGQNARDNYLFSTSWIVMNLNNTLLLVHPRDAVQ
jgi:hypothetical protein